MKRDIEAERIAAECMARIKAAEERKRTLTFHEINEAKESLQGEINGLIIRFQNKYAIGVSGIKLNTWKNTDGTKYCDETKVQLSYGEMFS